LGDDAGADWENTRDDSLQRIGRCASAELEPGFETEADDSGEDGCFGNEGDREKLKLATRATTRHRLVGWTPVH